MRGRPRYPGLLTPREQDVLALLRAGLTNEQIAARLGISFETAKWHVSEILSKLGVATREDAAAWSGGEPRWSFGRVLLALLGTAVVAGAVAGLALLAWGVQRSGGSGASTSASVSAVASGSPAPTAVVPGLTGTPIAGAGISSSDAGVVTLPLKIDDTHEWAPLGAYGDEIVLWANPGKSAVAEVEAPKYSLWDPATGLIRQAWTGDPGTQDIYSGSDGDWLALLHVRIGSLEGGSLVLRNLKTGEVRQLTDSAGGAGFSGDSTISGGYAVWTQDTFGSDASVTEDVRLYDIANGTTTTLASNSDSDKNISSAGVGGGKVVWLLTQGTGNAMSVIVYDIASGEETRYSLTSGVDTTAISDDGGYVVWEDASYDKHVIDLQSGAQTYVAHGQGLGVYVNDRYFSWDPANVGGPQPDESAGFYDLHSNELRELPHDPSVDTLTAHVMGHWFVWQSVPVSNGIEDRANGKWYALLLAD